MFYKKRTYTVSFQGRAGMLYKEKNKVVSIDSELIFEPPGITIYSDSINKWDAPNETEMISSIQKEIILKNIEIYLKKEGYIVDIA